MLARLLSVIAVIGLIIGLIVTPPAWAVNAAPVVTHSNMDDMASMEEMPSIKGSMNCCPQHKPAVPFCPKNCPWAALCVAKCFSNTIAAISHLVIASVAEPISLDGDQNRPRMGEPPPPRPPRT